MRHMTAGDESASVDARDEAARLARGLARHVRRRGAAGERRTRATKAERSQANAVETTRAASAETHARDAETARSPSNAATRVNAASRAQTRDTTAASARAPSDMTAASVGAESTVARSAEDVRRLAGGARDLGELRALVSQCEACGLCRTRTQTVFMDGTGSRRVLFVGEAPGADEDRRGVPFVGRAGQLLTDIITKGMGIERDEVFIANVLKCRPPDNRDPTTEEKATCTPWLDRQVELMDPEVVIPLGRHAAMHVLGGVASMGAMRGKIHERGGRKVIPTFHPAYLLRSPGEKKECWKDIQLAMGVLGLETKRGPGEPDASA
jgi:uracil-DNA glycosylase family 4